MASEEHWEKVRDDNGEVYWWSTKTNETRWDEPPGYAAQEAASAQKPAARPPPPPNRSPPPLPPSASGKIHGIVSAGATLVKSNSIRIKNIIRKDEPTKNPPTAPAAAVTNGERFEGRARKKSFQAAAFQAVQAVKSNLANPPVDPTTLDGHIHLQAKEQHKDVKEVIKGLQISEPSDVKKELEVSFDAENMQFTGLPAGWADEAHRQYGVPLQTCPRMVVDGYSDRIPIVLVKLKSRFLELGGLETDGIFRLAPDGQDVADAKLSINTGQALKSLERTKDPHVVANLIKQFFRELKPSKVLNVLSTEALTEMSNLSDLEAFGSRLQKLQDPQRSAFFWLLDLLCEVAAHQEVNRMTPINLAIVISPNLFDAPPNTDPFAELLLSQRVAAFTTKALNWRISQQHQAQEIHS